MGDVVAADRQQDLPGEGGDQCAGQNLAYGSGSRS